MSKAYRERFGSKKVTRVQMREHLHQEFPPGLTEQSHKAECDINNVIKKFNKTGLFTHVAKIEGRYGSMSGADFKTMQDVITGVNTEFNNLPSNIRNRFENDPRKMLQFFEDDNNRAEAIELGLISADSFPEADGLGEHATPEKIAAVAAEKAAEATVETPPE